MLFGKKEVKIAICLPRLKVSGSVTVPDDKKQSKLQLKLPYVKVDGNNTVTVKKVSSIFTRLEAPNIGIELLWGIDNRIYINVQEKLADKVSCEI